MPDRYTWLAPNNPCAVRDTASGTNFHLLSSEEAEVLTGMLNYLHEMAVANEQYFPHMMPMTPLTQTRIGKMPD